MKIIDVSHYNGAINWQKVAKDCDGVIIRAGYRGYSKGKLVTDTSFKKNIDGAKAAGLPIGVYFVTQAISVAEAKTEARYTMELVKGYKLDLPIFIDSENGNPAALGRADHGKLTKTQRTAILSAFCDEVTKGGYRSGVYSSESWYKDDLNYLELRKYYIWCARYSRFKPTIKYNAWQYTDRGRISGINGNVDISEFNDINIKPKKKTNEEIANEVIAGKWYTGAKRKKALEAAGYNYRAVQDIVNQKLRK